MVIVLKHGSVGTGGRFDDESKAATCRVRRQIAHLSASLAQAGTSPEDLSGMPTANVYSAARVAK